MTSVYQPSAGVVAVEPAALAALVEHARGRTSDRAAWQSLVDVGLIVGDRLDPPLRPFIDALLSEGPRLRVLSRARGRLTVTDASVDRSGHAAIVVRPPDASMLHLQHTTAGALARRLAGVVGLGAHVLAEAVFEQPLDLRDWAVVRSGFETREPSTWVARRRRAELHEVRWAASRRALAGTALVAACLDGGLAEVRPSETRGGAFTVAAADTVSVWARLCALTAASHSTERIPDGPKSDGRGTTRRPAGRDRHPGPV